MFRTIRKLPFGLISQKNYKYNGADTMSGNRFKLKLHINNTGNDVGDASGSEFQLHL